MRDLAGRLVSVYKTPIRTAISRKLIRAANVAGNYSRRYNRWRTLRARRRREDARPAGRPRTCLGHYAREKAMEARPGE